MASNGWVEEPPDQTDALDFEVFHINGLFLCVFFCPFGARTVRSSHAQQEFHDAVKISEYPYR